MASRSPRNKNSFSAVDPKAEFAQIEEKVLDFWKENKIFEKSLQKTEDGKSFVFYEGPPTANGKPGIHHVLARSFKDLFPRFHTMKGEYCLRKGGWDTHGLPVELEVEKELKISGKKDIENIVSGDKKASIAKFNELCCKSVFKYVEDWKKLTERMGFWIDIENAYATLDNKYIESCWTILKTFYDQGLLEKDYKVVPYCPRCGTPLSSHELSLGYDDTEDPSIYIRFRLEDESADVLVWTTTPWTLPGNVALAIDQEATYVKVQVGDGRPLVLAKERLSVLGKEKIEILEEFKGEELVGKKYTPLYKFYDFGESASAYQILPADFVSLEDGTGIVHTAVMYGADDFELGKKYNLPMYHLVDEEGKFKDEVDLWKGEFVKEADPKIVDDLKERELLYKEEKIVHSYPFCWRCKTPLIYYAITSWYIRTTKKKDQILEENQKINWVPEHTKDGRMGNWLEGMVDWSISRFRYWGTPLPIWKCESCEEENCIGSITELEEFTGEKLPEDFDLHRPYIDEFTRKCNKCGGVMTRYTDLVDVWFDSGSMPFAQWHYPFEKQELVDSGKQFPADFIAEGQDQTRGWFYTLLVLSTLYKGQSSYKNVISHNLVLDKEGKKMSKSVGNVVDPWEMMNKYGADVVRWYFYSSVNIGLPYKFDEEQLAGVSRQFFRILWNIYNFFVVNANADGWEPKEKPQARSVLDKWIYSKLQTTLEEVDKNLEEYNPTNVSRSIMDFVNDLSLWYVRRSRDRVGPTSENPEDKDAAYCALWEILTTLSKMMAPLAPFISEEIYRNLTKEESVHLADWPKFDESLVDQRLEQRMELVREIVEKGHAARKSAGIPVRQSLGELKIRSQNAKLDEGLLQLLKDEVNVKEVEWTETETELEIELDVTITPELEEEGKTRELARQIQEERKKLGASLDARVTVTAPWLPQKQDLLNWVKNRVLAEKIEKGEFLEVKIVS